MCVYDNTIDIILYNLHTYRYAATYIYARSKKQKRPRRFPAVVINYPAPESIPLRRARGDQSPAAAVYVVYTYLIYYQIGSTSTVFIEPEAYIYIYDDATGRQSYFQIPMRRGFFFHRVLRPLPPSPPPGSRPITY